MRRLLTHIVVAGMVGGMGFLHAQQAGKPGGAPVFKAGVQAVVVAASVRDGRGRVVRDLKKSDFQVIDTGFGRPIQEFYSGNAPVSLAVLLDISGSMAIGGNMDRARHAVGVATMNLNDAGDEAALFTFDSSLQQVVEFTKDMARVRQVSLRARRGESRLSSMRLPRRPVQLPGVITGIAQCW